VERLAASLGVEAEVCYFGEVAHQENRALVNLLDLHMRQLTDPEELEDYGGIAPVDHSRPGVNDSLPGEATIDVVIDHHPPREPIEARFVDLRSEVGATSTLLVDYLRQLGRTPEEDVATGLLFGIRIDTDEFTREVSVEDFRAAAFLLPHADLGTLERIESPSISAETIDTIARAITNRECHGPVLLSGVGRLSERDALAQAADRLLDLEDVTTTFVYGILDGTVHVSARARGAEIDLGETLRDAFGQIGSAGGHADMAGAQISLGLLEAVDEADESPAEVVRELLTDRFLEAVESRSHRTLSGLYADDFHAPSARLEAFDDGTGDGADPTDGGDATAEAAPGDETGDGPDGDPPADGSPADDGENEDGR
jgi:nanoRNase/pAp phosphatase (c-di-AMP/oligoRNAs hydrolase)